MDAERFDTLARSLTTTGSRRRALAALAGLLGLLGLAQPGDATAGGACKPSCNECATCKKGKCHKTKHGKVCKKGKCKPKPNDTTCNGTGKCLNETCNAQPSCMQFSAPCIVGTPPFCCSGICNNFNPFDVHCDKGAAGTMCLAATDCTSGSCIGYT